MNPLEAREIIDSIVLHLEESHTSSLSLVNRAWELQAFIYELEL